MAVEWSDSELAAPSPSHQVSPFLLAQDVKCLLCGYISGQFVRDPRGGPGSGSFRPSPGAQPPAAAERLRCGRCGGPVYLDEIERILRPLTEPLEKPRRGRKPKLRPTAG
jgi:hypothetical protein